MDSESAGSSVECRSDSPALRPDRPTPNYSGAHEKRATPFTAREAMTLTTVLIIAAVVLPVLGGFWFLARKWEALCKWFGEQEGH